MFFIAFLSQSPKDPLLQGHDRDKPAVAHPDISMRRPDPLLDPKSKITLPEILMERRAAPTLLTSDCGVGMRNDPPLML
ncbi:hypothetical protein H671_2g4380 [Cricetulus griseus]|nr:hypothetical protein H671_2g4380 [Cricetulus griseus]